MRLMAFLSRRPAVPLAVVILLGVSLCMTTVVWPDDSPKSRATLKGVKVVQVFVENIPPDAEQDGLLRFQLQSDIEDHLRQAGITVAPFSPAGYLYVKVDTAKGESGSYAVDVSVSFDQVVMLAREPAMSWMAPSWSVGYIGVVAQDRLREVQSHVIDLVDQFMIAYFEQNPRQ
jgi:hypothetical protein